MDSVTSKFKKFLKNDTSPRNSVPASTQQSSQPNRRHSRLSGLSKTTKLWVTFLHPFFFLFFLGSKPVAHPNDYRPDPTGGRGGADRIRSDHNGRNGNGLQRNPSGATNPVVASNSPAHLSSVNIQQPSSAAGMIIPTGTRSIRGQIVVALYTYQGSEFGDMSFKKGDMMEIVDDT